MPLNIFKQKERPVIAFDSTKLIRGKSPRPFTALVGVGVNTEEPSKFKQRVLAAFQGFAQKHNFELTKPVYCSSELGSILMGQKNFEYDAFCNALEELINSVVDESKISVFFTTFNTQRLTKTDGKIIKFGAEKDTLQTMSIDPVVFLRDELSQYHHIACAWLFQNRTKCAGLDFYLDGCRAPITSAWDELSASDNNIYVFTRGDQSNVFICMADIIAKYVDLALRRNRTMLKEEEIRGALNIKAKEIYVNYLGNPHLEVITPKFKDSNKIGKLVDLTSYYKRPRYFLVREAQDELLTSEQAIDLLETTKLMDAVYSMAIKNNGAVKFFEPRDKIQEGDTFVTYGKKGEETFTRYAELGCKIIHQTAKSLIGNK